MLPMTATMRARISGTPRPTPIGIAPRSSITGSIETSKTTRSFRIIIGWGYYSVGCSSVLEFVDSSVPLRTAWIFCLAVSTVASSGYMTERTWLG